MSVGEVVGLVITVGLLGVIAGGMLTALLAVRSSRLDTIRQRRAAALSHWLAARLTLSRCANSFIAAFRALAFEPRGSSLRALRLDEAQRARARLFAALRDLDRAEADLITRVPDPAIHLQLDSFKRLTPEELRAAIDGDSKNVATLVGKFRRDDQRAIAFVRFTAARIGTGNGQSPLRDLVDRLAVLARSTLDQWGRR